MQSSSHWTSGSKVQRSEVGRSPHWSKCEKLGPLSSTVVALYYPKKIPSKIGSLIGGSSKEFVRHELTPSLSSRPSIGHTLPYQVPQLVAQSITTGKFFPIPTYAPWPIFCLPSILAPCNLAWHSLSSLLPTVDSRRAEGVNSTTLRKSTYRCPFSCSVSPKVKTSAVYQRCSVVRFRGNKGQWLWVVRFRGNKGQWLLNFR